MAQPTPFYTSTAVEINAQITPRWFFLGDVIHAVIEPNIWLAQKKEAACAASREGGVRFTPFSRSVEPRNFYSDGLPSAM